MKRGARFQQTLASQASFAKYSRKSKRELFLDQMNQVVPWSELLALVEPVYPKAGNGRQPVGLAIMLRTYFLQHWFGFVFIQGIDEHGKDRIVGFSEQQLSTFPFEVQTSSAVKSGQLRFNPNVAENLF